MKSEGSGGLEGWAAGQLFWRDGAHTEDSNLRLSRVRIPHLTLGSDCLDRVSTERRAKVVQEVREHKVRSLVAPSEVKRLMMSLKTGSAVPEGARGMSSECCCKVGESWWGQKLPCQSHLIGEHEVVWTPWMCSSLVYWSCSSLPELKVGGLVALEDFPALWFHDVVSQCFSLWMN